MKKYRKSGVYRDIYRDIAIGIYIAVVCMINKICDGKNITQGKYIINLYIYIYILTYKSQPTHTLLPQSSSCIYLNIHSPAKLNSLASQLIVVSTYFYIQTATIRFWITKCKLNLNIEYSPPYKRLVWDYYKANVESIKKSIARVLIGK